MNYYNVLVHPMTTEISKSHRVEAKIYSCQLAKNKLLEHNGAKAV